MKRGLPKSEIERLGKFYDDYGTLMGWLKPVEPGENEPEHPADELRPDGRISGAPNR